MGIKSDLKPEEKTQIVQKLSEGLSTGEIAKLLHRDPRIIRAFARDSKGGRKKRKQEKFRNLTQKDLI